MITFPSKARVGRIMPKEAFYKRLDLSSELKEKFVSDIKRIVLEYSLTPETLNIEKSDKTAEILVLSVELKKQEFDFKIVEAIARQNPHNLLFLLKYETFGRLALFYGKVYATEWKPLEDLRLEAKGFKIEDIWNGFIEQIALQKEPSTDDELSVDEQLKKQDTIKKLQKDIEKLERLSRIEKQPKKRFELYQKLQYSKKMLEDLE